VPDRNVVAAIEGSDPRLKDEWIVITGHVDHNGAVGDTIFAAIMIILNLAAFWPYERSGFSPVTAATAMKAWFPAVK
jgi:hypothetical protein